MKLYQGYQTLACGKMNSGSMESFDLFYNMVEGVENFDRLGNKIRLWRVDLTVYVETNVLQLIPEENIQLVIYRTKRVLQGDYPITPAQLFLRPPGTIPTVGPGPSAGGTDGSWLPRLWLLNPASTGLAKVMSIKNYVIHQQGANIIGGTAAPNISTVTACNSVNINTPKRYRHYGKYFFNFKKGMSVQFQKDTGDDAFTFIPSSRNWADNHVWCAAFGETEPTYAHTFHIGFNLWYTDQ